jgi:uncharacterized membrane protein YesL
MNLFKPRPFSIKHRTERDHMFLKCVLMLVWMIFSVILSCTVIGLILFVATGDDNNPSVWSQVGRDLAENITRKKE